MYAPITVSGHLKNYLTLKVFGFYTPYTQTKIDDYFYLLKYECLRSSVIASVSYLYTNIYLRLMDTEIYAHTHHSLLIFSSGMKLSTSNIVWLLHVIHTDKNWILKAFILIHTLHIHRNGLLYSSKYIVGYLRIFFYLHLLDTGKYVHAHHSFLTFKNYLTLKLFSFYSPHTHIEFWMEIFNFESLYLLVYLYLLDTEKYVRTHRSLLTPEKLRNFEGIWLLHTVHTDANCWWLFLSFEMRVSQI